MSLLFIQSDEDSFWDILITLNHKKNSELVRWSSKIVLESHTIFVLVPGELFKEDSASTILVLAQLQYATLWSTKYYCTPRTSQYCTVFSFFFSLFATTFFPARLTVLEHCAHASSSVSTFNFKLKQHYFVCPQDFISIIIEWQLCSYSSYVKILVNEYGHQQGTIIIIIIIIINSEELRHGHNK
jgi:hypothetical protein